MRELPPEHRRGLAPAVAVDDLFFDGDERHERCEATELEAEAFDLFTYGDGIIHLVTGVC